MKRRIHQNIWGNWNAYVGKKKFMEFGTNHAAAEKWLETGEVEEVPFPIDMLTKGKGRPVRMWKPVNQPPSDRKRILVFSPEYAEGHEMRFRILDSHFLKL